MKNHSVTKGRIEETLGRKSKCMEVKQEEAVKRGYDIQRSIEDAKIFNSSPQLKKKKEKKRLS